MTNPNSDTNKLEISLHLAIILGSIAVHIDEYLSPTGHPVDIEAIRSLLQDEELQHWITEMNVLLPLKRG